MRHTKAHTKNRRAHHKVADNTITKDATSGVPHLRHRASLETGLYRGRQVLDVAKKAEKKAAKNK
jgi:ribosomal protein L32